MKIQIKTLEDVQERAKEPFEECTALISVSFGDEYWKDFDYKPQYILEVNIDDGPLDDDGNPTGFALVTPEQAEEIAGFIKQHLDELDVLICQSFPCDEYGVSIAIAAAVEDFMIHDNGEKFSKNGCYGGYYDAYKMLKDALAGKENRYAALIEEDDDCCCTIRVEEIDTAELV